MKHEDIERLNSCIDSVNKALSQLKDNEAKESFNYIVDQMWNLIPAPTGGAYFGFIPEE